MAHVVDRAVAFRFCDPPYVCVAVRPDGVVLERPGSRLFVTATPEVREWMRRGEEPVLFFDEVNAVQVSDYIK